MATKPKLGSGERFKQLEGKLKSRMASHSHGKKEVHDPAALAAWIGRKKYGKAGFAKLSAGGR